MLKQYLYYKQTNKLLFIKIVCFIFLFVLLFNNTSYIGDNNMQVSSYSSMIKKRKPRSIKYSNYQSYFKKNIMNKADPDNILDVNYDSEFYAKYGSKHYKNINNILSHAPKLESSVWKKFENDFKIKDVTSSEIARCYGILGVSLNLYKDSRGNNYRNPYQVSFHEFGHHIDFISNYKFGNNKTNIAYSYYYKDNLFGRTIKEEVDNYLTKISENDDTSDADKKLEEILKSLDYFDVFLLSDIIQGATDSRVSIGGGHGAEYWLSSSANLPCEAFAEMFESSIANKMQIDTIKKYLPKSYEVYQEILSDMLLKN